MSDCCEPFVSWIYTFSPDGEREIIFAEDRIKYDLEPIHWHYNGPEAKAAFDESIS